MLHPCAFHYTHFFSPHLLLPLLFPFHLSQGVLSPAFHVSPLPSLSFSPNDSSSPFSGLSHMHPHQCRQSLFCRSLVALTHSQFYTPFLALSLLAAFLLLLLLSSLSPASPSSLPFHNQHSVYSRTRSWVLRCSSKKAFLVPVNLLLREKCPGYHKNTPPSPSISNNLLIVLFYFFFKGLFFFYIWVLFLHVCLCITCVYECLVPVEVSRGHPLELKLRWLQASV